MKTIKELEAEMKERTYGKGFDNAIDYSKIQAKRDQSVEVLKLIDKKIASFRKDNLNIATYIVPHLVELKDAISGEKKK